MTVSSDLVARLRKLRDENESSLFRSEIKTLSEAADALAAYEALLKEAEGALDWYREQSRLARLIHSEGDSGRHAIAQDGGNRAATLLTKLKEARNAG